MADVKLYAAFLLFCFSASAVATEPTVSIAVHGPTVIGFFPPTSDDELAHDDGGLNEGIAHVRFALEDLANCLADHQVAVRYEFTRSLTISDGSESKRYDFPTDWSHAVGILLAAPGRSPEVVFATIGPSSLQWTALDAAARYFSESKCARGMSESK